jgi:hypothetical protein
LKKRRFPALFSCPDFADRSASLPRRWRKLSSDSPIRDLQSKSCRRNGGSVERRRFDFRFGIRDLLAVTTRAVGDTAFGTSVAARLDVLALGAATGSGDAAAGVFAAAGLSWRATGFSVTAAAGAGTGGFAETGAATGTATSLG